MNYEKPQVLDYGDLLTLTAAQGAIGTEDGFGGKTIQAGVGGVVGVSVGVF
jgi:hypothetical protein